MIFDEMVHQQQLSSKRKKGLNLSTESTAEQKTPRKQSNQDIEGIPINVGKDEAIVSVYSI